MSDRVCGDGNPALIEPIIRHIPENHVEYFLVLLNSQTGSEGQHRELETLRKSSVEFAEALTNDYIWQRDNFQLCLKTQDELHYLYGLSEYGDAVEDEWLIVYILRELTIHHPNLWVRVVDGDGEFLLVEAANALPDWLSPEIDHNRVWICNGELLLIPQHDEEQEQTQPHQMSLTQAVAFCQSRSTELVRSPAIQDEAFYRLGRYPKQIADSIHHSMVIVPRKLALILHLLPNSVSRAVECFYLRDPLSLERVASASGPLAFPPEDMVTSTVRFSRVLFAQLRSQHVTTPQGWQKVVHKLVSSVAEHDEMGMTRLETGMKLTIGFEMLAAEFPRSRIKVVRQVGTLLQDFAEGRRTALPTDEDMKSWRDYRCDDDETWMDINYEDFKRELDGKHGGGIAETSSGFGDARTQVDIRRIVSRFEAFLSDESAGLDGAELGANGDDLGEEGRTADPHDDTDSDHEDKAVSLNEDTFSRLIQNMGPAGPTTDLLASIDNVPKSSITTGLAKTCPGAGEDATIQELSCLIEAELKTFGALENRECPSAMTSPAVPEHGDIAEEQSAGQALTSDMVEAFGVDDAEIDFNLARNLMESFKSQAGMAGPTGNLLGMMGFQLPRDEGTGEEV